MDNMFILTGHCLLALCALVYALLVSYFLTKNPGLPSLYAALMLTIIVGLAFGIATTSLQIKADDLAEAERYTRLYKMGLDDLSVSYYKTLRNCGGKAEKAWVFTATQKGTNKPVEGYICPNNEIVYLPD